MRDSLRQFGMSLAKLLGLVGLAAGIGLVSAYLVLRPEVPEDADLWTINRTRAMTFLDTRGEVIGSRGGLHTDPIPLQELPPHLVQAFLNTEDKRFYDHGAIDWWGIARAMVINVWEGRVVQGGSSITQQLAKNIFLSQERTLARKVKEVILASELEEILTKDEILELYLNRIYLGGGAFGVEAASQTFFDKSARDVSLAEAAMLAGLAKAPSRYAPTTNLQRAQDRAKVVLNSLRDNDVISDTDYALALARPATLTSQYVSGEVNYYLDHVNSEVNAILDDLGFDDEQMATVDLIVTTTLDRNIQGKAEKALTAILDERAETLDIEQGALVALATDGAIRAMVGGRSYKESQFNRAVQAMRQPGSAFKPFVYLTALQQGRRTNSTYYDEPITIGDWSPSNYGDGYRGRVTMTEALQHSINTVAVRVNQEIGGENVVETAHAMGIESPLDVNRSLPLGTEEVNLLELTSAYIPFATRGFASPSYAVTKVTTSKDTVLWGIEDEQRAPIRVISPDHAKDMTHMMHQVMISGTGRRANLGNRPAAGKTGTSQEWRDAWFMGYTGDLITGVWVGNDDSSPMQRVTGGGVPAEIWQRFMTDTHQGWAMTALPGTYPARNDRQDGDMRRLLSDLSRDLSKIAGKRSSSSSSSSRKSRKPSWWPF